MLDPLTLYVSLSILSVIIIFDIWTLLRRGYNTTISWNLLVLSQKEPIVAFALGVAFGHLFWGNHAVCPK